MNKLVFTTTAVLLLLVLFETSVAKPRNVDADPDPPGGGAIETLNGSPEDNGHLSGVAEQAKYEERERLRQEEEKLDGDYYETEIAFLEWIKEFGEIGEPPNMTPTVDEYMKNNNLTMEDVKRLYVDASGSLNRKRSAAINIFGIWNKCIVPYTFSDTLEDANKLNAQAGMKVLEKETGFRFYPYNNSNAAMELGHNNYLNFIQSSKCFSSIGNKPAKVGQDISACTTVLTAIHELAHALGMTHEQELVGSWPFLDVHYKESTHISTHGRWNLAEVYQDSKSYDPSSVMQYAPWGYQRDYIWVLSTMDYDFNFMLHKRNVFYLFKAIQEYNRCYDEFPSCSPLPSCEWDGYPSVIDGKCQCRCPEGLDPATGCSTVKPTPHNVAWPKGKYSFLKTNVDPCPEGFSTGTMYCNPAWDVLNSSIYHVEKFDADEYAHNVCTKTEEGTGASWPAGRYCILRYGGICPDGFESGLADTYGEVPTKQDVGTVPDGEHGQLFEYIFCCRNDGEVEDPIKLPFKSSFILYLGEDYYSGCQDVEGMYHVEEKYYMKNDIDKHTHRRTGNLPYLYQWSQWTEYIYYCAYFPNLRTDCSVAKTLSKTEKTYTFTTPHFPNNYHKGSMCSWYIRSPEGSRMQLDFTKFEISHATDTDCQAYVSIKSFRPGSSGFKFCGHNYQKTHWTYTNYLTVDFVSDLSPTQTGFSATVRVFAAEDKCYKGDGRDRSYAGKVTYDKDFNNCVPWSQVTNCPFHQFDTRFVDNDLAEHNYCRNIGIAGQPWCYTNAEKCLRQNCDACMTGNCFDMFDDCQTLMTADSSYCSKNMNGEASRGCKKSCGECGKHTEIAAGATCGAPPIVKGIIPAPTKESYKVGDVVKYKCPTGTDWRESVCTSEGQWTQLNFVCGACPSGWAAWKGNCYKYLDWDTNVDYPTAVSLCANFSAHLIKVDSEEKHTLFISLGDYYPETMGFTWIGLTKDIEGNWVWQDGSQLSRTFWNYKQPDNNEKEKCAMADYTNALWKDKPCTDKANVVCEYTPTGPFSCEDQISNCDAVISTTPDVCTAYPDYAWANCRKSCAVGDCSSSVTCIDDANIGTKGSRIEGGDTINLGQIVKYECAEGYEHISGDLTRGCRQSGSLTGFPPVCSNDEGSEIELFDKKPYTAISPRKSKFEGPWTYLTTKGGMTFPRAGKVTSWTFYSHLKDGEVAFQIFRPSADPLKNLTFTFIGQNHVTSLPELRIHTVQIPEAQQVAVQQGDIYGIWLKSAEISYDGCTAKLHENDFAGFIYPVDGISPSKAEVGKEYKFVDWKKCMMIGVKAMFKVGA